MDNRARLAAKLTIVAMLLSVSGCHLIVAPFLMARGLEKRDYPAKVEEPAEWSFGTKVRRRGAEIYVWVGYPKWGRVRGEWVKDKYRVERYTLNSPMIVVYLNEMTNTPRCRWSEVRMYQRRWGLGASEQFSSGDGYSVDSEPGQYAGDCKKLKALLGDDPAYAPVVAKL
jgi:hypothetical protein